LLSTKNWFVGGVKAEVSKFSAPIIKRNNNGRWFSSLQDHPSNIWEQMDEKSRALAEQLVGDDLIGSDEPEEVIKNHNFCRRRSLSQAITMIESRKPYHVDQANLLLTYLLAHENHKRKGTSFRLGIAGSPGAGELSRLFLG
jgi:hypothetical protein